MNWTEEIVEKSTPEELVKMQLDEWAAEDSALAETYDKSRLEDCWDWIEEKARELLSGGSGAVWHVSMDTMWNDQKLHEECGVFGVFAKDPEPVAEMSYYGLYALQHRGQEGCGIVVNDDGVFNMLSRLVITFLPRSKGLLISWLQSPSAVMKTATITK